MRVETWSLHEAINDMCSCEVKSKHGVMYFVDWWSTYKSFNSLRGRLMFPPIQRVHHLALQDTCKPQVPHAQGQTHSCGARGQADCCRIIVPTSRPNTPNARAQRGDVQ